MEVKHYISSEGKDIYQSWLDSIKDKVAKISITRRIDRIKIHGHFGDYRTLRSGVSEIKIDVGGGYRVYYSKIGEIILLLLCGGDKATQSQDIDRAINYLKDFKQKGGIECE